LTSPAARLLRELYRLRLANDLRQSIGGEIESSEQLLLPFG